MKYNQLIYYVVLMFFIGGCFGQGKDVSNASLMSEKEKRIVFHVPIEGSKSLHNIVYSQEKISNRWLLQLRKRNGLIVYKQMEKHKNADKEFEITLEEYSLALDNALSVIEHKYPNSHLDQIQIDIDLIEEVLGDVVDTTKVEVERLSGVIGHKNQQLQKEIIKKLIGSEIMSTTCNVLKRYSYECDRNVISINPIAFRSEYMHKDWSEILTVTDAGLNRSMWFGINVSR